MTNNRTPLVAGNWKMNGSRSLVETFSHSLNAQSFEGLDVVVCPPDGYLSMFNNEHFSLGAQDVSHLDNGAHTGDMSTDMLKELGAKYVIVGHSERREDHNETNLLVAKKAAKAKQAGLIPIICVGESLSVREAGDVKSFVGEQIAALFAEMTSDTLNDAVIAYEPIWAIGTGKTATPEQAQEVHAFIRKTLTEHDEALAHRTRILYGGSVKPDNAKALFGQPDIDGGLIGGASLKTDDFMAICQAAI
ncbi:triose-phosphate isomerase [Salinimonas sp. HHU 13199]|uniref:Triosephosphate isomerase n=1 Tax=Salinimonas profundi TaxID=2729140 RepID=A0ABR8LI35_9ALTE|nr:triose-phosphate isomerase [Salinimonas profundi]MBD3584636.1 triose-phosphate isomerase [Salinimonas profundi]